MTTEFKAMLALWNRKKNPVQGEWRCELAVPGDAPVGSRENPVHGCRITTEARIDPGKAGYVDVRLADPWVGDIPEYFLVCEGRVVGFLQVQKVPSPTLRQRQAALMAQIRRDMGYE